jgi:hypothetical protein
MYFVCISNTSWLGFFREIITIHSMSITKLIEAKQISLVIIILDFYSWGDVPVWTGDVCDGGGPRPDKIEFVSIITSVGSSLPRFIPFVSADISTRRFVSFTTIVVFLALRALLFSLDRTCSILGRDTIYPQWLFGFLQSLHANLGIINETRPWPLQSMLSS